jgi:hypothetical protein
MGFLDFMKKKPEKKEDVQPVPEQAPPPTPGQAPPTPVAEAPPLAKAEAPPLTKKQKPPAEQQLEKYFIGVSSPEEALGLACSACDMGEKALFICEEKISPIPETTFLNWSRKHGWKVVEKQKQGLLHIFILKEKAEKPGMKEKRIMRIAGIVDQQQPGTVAICLPFITPELRKELESRKIKTIFAVI